MKSNNPVQRLIIFILVSSLILILNMLYVSTGEADDIFWSKFELQIESHT
jgi:hypothetical protein